MVTDLWARLPFFCRARVATAIGGEAEVTGEPALKVQFEKLKNTDTAVISLDDLEQLTKFSFMLNHDDQGELHALRLKVLEDAATAMASTKKGSTKRKAPEVDAALVMFGGAK